MTKPEDLQELEASAQNIPLNIEHLKGTIYRVTSCNDYYCALDLILDASTMQVRSVVGEIIPYIYGDIDYNDLENIDALKWVFNDFIHAKAYCKDTLWTRYGGSLNLPYGYGARISNMIANHMKSGSYD